jgi:hypothetical protein
MPLRRVCSVLIACGSWLSWSTVAHASISGESVDVLTFRDKASGQVASFKDQKDVETPKTPLHSPVLGWFATETASTVEDSLVREADFAGPVTWDASDLNTPRTLVLSFAPASDSDPAEAEGYLSQRSGGDEPSFWQLNLTPNVFIPVSDGGRNFNETINYGGRFEAWNTANNVTLFIEPSYRERGLLQTIVRDVPPQLQNQIPSEFRSDLDSKFLNVDLGLGYRFFDRVGTSPSSLASEFDIPQVSFDIMAGARLFFTSNTITGTTNLGQTMQPTNPNQFTEKAWQAIVRTPEIAKGQAPADRK